MRQLDFIGKRNLWFAVSALLIVISLVSMFMPGRGLRLGIDFTGGIMMDVRFSRAVSTSEVRAALESVKLGDSQIQKTDGENEVLIRTRALTTDESKALNEALKAKFGEYETLRTEDVKGVVGGELARKGIMALILANVGMVLYVTIRFEYKFAVTAIIALIHDVIIMLGAYSVLGLEANSPTIAAVLTIVGYSINDTIVVFDRIRENLKRRKKESLAEIVNMSTNQTMTRSLNTSLTTLLAIMAVVVFGGRTTRDFSMALMVGVASGTYSSIFVASPLWYLWKLKEERAQDRLVLEPAAAHAQVAAGACAGAAAVSAAGGAAASATGGAAASSAAAPTARKPSGKGGALPKGAAAQRKGGRKR